MLSVDKDTNVLDDKKEAVVTMPLSEKKLLTTEKVTTSDEVHKRTNKITTREEVVKVNHEFYKSTERTKTNEEAEKGNEKLEDTKQSVVTIGRKDSDMVEGQSKLSTEWLNLDHEIFGMIIFHT